MAVTIGEGTRHLAAAADAISNTIVQGFVFHNATTAGHECKVTDALGVEAFHAKCVVANDNTVVMLPRPVFFRTLTVATLTSGELMVYVA